MARIKIEDLPVLEDLSERQMKGIFGGLYTPPTNSTIQLEAELEALRRDPDAPLEFSVAGSASTGERNIQKLAEDRAQAVMSFYVEYPGTAAKSK